MENEKREITFERYEKKYMIPPEKYPQLISEIEKHMTLDQYGLHTISSIYYDTEDFEIIRKYLDKPKFKEKLRVRGYGKPSDETIIFLELKKKISGITYKRRVPITLRQSRDYLDKQVIPDVENEQIFDEIDWYVKHKHVEKKVVISYDRVAYFGKEDSNFRLTFDSDIRWRDYHLDLSKGDYGYALNNPGVRLMEVKTIGTIPLWLCDILSKMKIYPQSFSKYGTIYSNYLTEKGRGVASIAG
ncbi:MAG: polyphosphate polymerase domain-containing protein [Suipraeoptans sp.]